MSKMSGGVRSRPPTGTAAAGAAPAAPELLRRRLAQAQAQLREMEEEMRRVAAQQARETEAIEAEYNAYMEKLELVRMQECLSAAELEGLVHDTDTTTRSGKAAFDSRLLASNSVKYREARDRAQKKRTECAEVEAQLAAAQQRLTDARREREASRRRAEEWSYATTAQTSRASESESRAREVLRGLEAHVATEEERLSAMATEAKELRSSIDTMLIAQTQFEDNYRARENDLLLKKKQMAFLIETCTLLFEERDKKQGEVEELRKLSDEENRQYEAALEELDGVLREDGRAQGTHDEQLLATQRQLRETQTERVSVHKSNTLAETELRRAREEGLKAGQLFRSSVVYEAGEGDSAAPPDGNHSASSDPESSEQALSPAQQQIHEFDVLYERLSELAGSDRLEDVVTYLDRGAEERFRLFSELNYLQDEAATLRAEKSRLVEKLSGVRGAPGLVRVSAAADSGPIGASARSASVASTSARVDPEAASPRGEHIHEELQTLQDTLHLLKLRNVEQSEEAESLQTVFSQVVLQAGQLFDALGCDAEVLRQQSGTSRVLKTNVSQCLALVDQRVEEYLLAAARQAADVQYAPGQPTALAPTAPKHSVARTFLRRPDLPAKAPATGARAASGRSHTTRSTDRMALASGLQSTNRRGVTAQALVQEAVAGLPSSVDARPPLAVGSSHAHAATVGGSPFSQSSGRTPLRSPYTPQRGASTEHRTPDRGRGSSRGAHAAAATSVAEESLPLSMEEMKDIVRERQPASFNGTGGALPS